MAGIYIHIPFCKQRCSYCDFFSSTDFRMKKSYIFSVCNELYDRKTYLREPVDTIYFGGGTPSVLEFNELEAIFATIYSIYGDSKNREVTIEVNPDDITFEYVITLKHFPINRISMGIQSFDDCELQLLNRRHNAQSAKQAVHRLQQAGYGNISIDLMYGLPGQTIKTWEKTLQQAIDLQVQHISAYHLTYEKGTTLHKQLNEGTLIPTNDELSNRMYEVLMDTLVSNGFEHYEISNFARHGFQSRHNSSYWDGSHYLGIGASAHSYNGTERRWNRKTVKSKDWTLDFETEILDNKMKYNDFIITRLRLMKGMDLNELSAFFGESRKTDCLRQAEKHIVNGLLKYEDNRLRLTRKGIFLSDGIMSDLME